MNSPILIIIPLLLFQNIFKIHDLIYCRIFLFKKKEKKFLRREKLTSCENGELKLILLIQELNFVRTKKGRQRVNRSRERRKERSERKREKRSKHWRETVEIRILFAHRNSYQGVIASISERFAQRREPFSLSGHFVHFRSRDADEIHLLPPTPLPTPSARLPSRHRKPLCVPTPFFGLFFVRQSVYITRRTTERIRIESVFKTTITPL